MGTDRNDEVRMTNDEEMTKQQKRTSSGALILVHHLGQALGSARASRADFGALAEISLLPRSANTGKVRDHEGVIASTRGACAPL